MATFEEKERSEKIRLAGDFLVGQMQNWLDQGPAIYFRKVVSLTKDLFKDIAIHDDPASRSALCSVFARVVFSIPQTEMLAKNVTSLGYMECLKISLKKGGELQDILVKTLGLYLNIPATHPLEKDVAELWYQAARKLDPYEAIQWADTAIQYGGLLEKAAQKLKKEAGIRMGDHDFAFEA